jgi:hypothetical protein
MKAPGAVRPTNVKKGGGLGAYGGNKSGGIGSRGTAKNPPREGVSGGIAARKGDAMPESGGIGSRADEQDLAPRTPGGLLTSSSRRRRGLIGRGDPADRYRNSRSLSDLLGV